MINHTTFKHWDCKTNFNNTIYVDIKNPQADDNNPGTLSHPFKSIQAAASVIKPGERIEISAGIYRETINLKNNGENREKMISLESAPRAKVIISGTEPWEVEWKPSSGYRSSIPHKKYYADDNAIVWMGNLPYEHFIGYNPFGMVNVPSIGWNGEPTPLRSIPGWAPDKDYLKRRGLIFADDYLLKQVTYPFELWQEAGTYWVDNEGLSVHFRLPNDDNPNNLKMEYTARSRGLTALNKHSSYIRIKGLTFEKFGNGFPPPQTGVISTNCGQHWIIEDCTINYANSIGIDMGFLSPETETKGFAGGHIIRRNLIQHCGVSAICGVPGGGSYMNDVLIEDNILKNNCWQNVEFDFENSAIKSHWMKNCLIRNNLIKDNGYGSAIWIDFQNDNTRVTGNKIINCKETLFGAIFIEATHKPVEIDNNLIVGVGNMEHEFDNNEHGGHGIYEHDSDKIFIHHNVILGAAGYGIFLHLGAMDRIVNDRGPTGRDHKIEKNLIHGCGRAILVPTSHNYLNKNIYGKFRQSDGVLRIQHPYQKLNLEAWQDFLGWDIEGEKREITFEQKENKLILSMIQSDKKLQYILDYDSLISNKIAEIFDGR
jgi:hypothetical protein